MKVEMNDWETVTSHDKTKYFVSLSFKQVITNKDGTVDSIICMDDIGIKDGKIIESKEYSKYL